jgi:hypothetical protein
LENKANERIERPGFTAWLLRWLPKQKALFVFSFFLFISIPVVISIIYIFLPVARSPLLPSEAYLSNVDTSSIGNAVNWDKHSLKHIAAKELEKTVLLNRLSLAAKDSIYLLLNLNDSTLSVEIKGLTVHTARASELFVSRRILRASHDALLKWIDQPFTFQQELSTIAKTPILIIDAPKDTSEAARLPRKPLEPENDFVLYSLLFDRDLLLEVKQSEDALPEDAESIASYQYRFDTTFNTPFFKKLINPMPSHRYVKIRITMPQTDARTIFRAMPHSVYAKLILIPPY